MTDRFRRTALVVALALTGLALAVGLAVLTSRLTTQHVGLAGEPPRQGLRLVARPRPPVQHPRTVTQRVRTVTQPPRTVTQQAPPVTQQAPPVTQQAPPVAPSQPTHPSHPADDSSHAGGDD